MSGLGKLFCLQSHEAHHCPFSMGEARSQKPEAMGYLVSRLDAHKFAQTTGLKAITAALKVSHQQQQLVLGGERCC